MGETTHRQEGNTLTIERTFNGPITSVWKAYSDKKVFDKWWGPEGWQTTTTEFDFREGGRIHYDMHCVDKNQGEWFDQHSWGLMLIETINEPSALSFTDSFTDESGEPNNEMPSLKTVVSLEEADGKTTMTIDATGETPEQMKDLLEMGIVEGFSSQMSKLDTLLESDK